MELNKIFITDTSKDTRIWLEQIDNFGNDKHLSKLNNLDVNVWSLMDKRRDELSYYHGKKRAAVHIGDCYQQVITDLLTEVLTSHGIPKELISCTIDGANTIYLIDNNPSLTTERIEYIINSQKKDKVNCCYSNEIYVGQN